MIDNCQIQELFILMQEMAYTDQDLDLLIIQLIELLDIMVLIILLISKINN
jgi:hypothetical protein